MNAKVLGFTWELAKGISIDTLTQLIADEQGGEVQIGRTRRLLVVHDTPTHVYGMTITPKNRKSLTFIIESDSSSEEQKRWRTIRELLGRDKRQMEFNFFIIHKKNNRGLYMVTYDSCSLWSFCSFVRKIHNDYGNKQIEMKLQKAQREGTLNNKLRRQVKDAYQTFKWKCKMSQSSWEHIIRGASSIQSIDFQVQTPRLNDEYGVKINDSIKWQTKKYSFIPKLKPDDTMISFIKSIFKNDSPKEFKANIIIDDVAEKIYLDKDNKDTFGKFDMDDLSILITMDNVFNDFKTSNIIGTLDTIAQEHSGWLN